VRRVVVLGAGGFVGAELLRLVVTHPRLELAAALSASHAGRAVGEVLPHLAPWTEVRFSEATTFPWDRLADGAWTVLAALGHGDSAATLSPLLDRVAPWDVQVVDLSGDFRLRDAATYELSYGRPHPAPERLGSAVYGLPELTRALLPGARFVASAGCFATAAILSIAPAAGASWGLDSIAIAGMTGSSGAGAAPGPATHHPRRAGNVEAYRPLDHQHLPEIAAAFAAAGGKPGVRIGFVPHRAPMVRGIYVTAVLTGSAPVDGERAVERYRVFYRDAPFVRVLDRPPAVVEVWGSNRCDLQVTARDGLVAVSAAVDNLVKGAAGQAIQNLNLVNSWPETEGLLHPAPWPV
jgi:N-acetyl-gamma-glutamyl-phosphate reductase